MTVLKEDDSEFFRHMEKYLMRLENKWILKELKSDSGGAFISKDPAGQI
jgi:hypothetical protein